jgi:hypothetical protein
MSDVNHGGEWQPATDHKSLPGPLHPEIDSLPQGGGASNSAESSEIPPAEDVEDRSLPAPSGDSPHPLPRRHARLPPLIRDSGLWVWLWVVGAIVFVVLIIIVAVLVLPSKQRVGIPHGVSGMALQSTPCPTRML